MSKHITRKIKSILTVSLCCTMALQNVMIIGNAEQADLSVENQININSNNSQVEENSQEPVIEDEENLENNDSVEQEEENQTTDAVPEETTEEEVVEETTTAETIEEDPVHPDFGIAMASSGAMANLEIVGLTNPNAIGSGIVTASETLNVRSGPSTSYEKLGTLKANEKIEILGTSNGWYKIDFNGKEGYVSPSYVALNALEKGIDVSYHNGTIDWKKVKESGVNYAIIRAGYGVSSVDKKFHENIQGAINAGLKIGIYWFSYAASTERAQLEAQKCLETIAPYKNSISYPVFFDYEYDSIDKRHDKEVTVTKDLVTDMANVFMNTVKSQGYVTGIYTNPDFGSRYYHNNVLFSTNVWCAQYYYKNTFGKPYSMWQYTDKGTVPGISGPVDLNYTTLRTFDIDKPVEPNPDPIPPTSDTGVTTANVNLRTGPSTSYSIITTIPNGSKVEILDKSISDWYKVKYNGNVGYCSSKYIKVDEVIITPPPTSDLKGWQLIGGKWYYYDNEGKMVKGWLEINGIYYYLKSNGEMATGWINIDGTYFYLKEDGQMATGWINIDGIYYYLQEGGQMATGWINIDGIYYYLREGGQMATGWINIDGIYYYLQEGGQMATGWINIDGIYYYLKEGGQMATGWINIDGTWYYLKEGGQMATGWIQLNGTWYYLKEGGQMATGWIQLNGTWYYLMESGAMAVNTVIDGWRIDANGVATPPR